MLLTVNPIEGLAVLIFWIAARRGGVFSTGAMPDGFWRFSHR